jgi:poly(ADP-ribose) glycohydrolase ARH3
MSTADLSLRAASEAATAVFPDGSFGNGAAMRVAPVGALHADDPQRVRRAAERQAVITHAHPVGVDAAVVQAQAVADAVRAGRFSRDDLTAIAATATTPALQASLGRAAEQAAVWDSAVTDPAAVAAAIGTDVVADQSVASALWVAAVAEDLRAAVVLSLALGGDVDTIAAMACAVLGGGATAAAIPSQWCARLEDGPRGRSFATTLANRLAQAGV